MTFPSAFLAAFLGALAAVAVIGFLTLPLDTSFHRAMVESQAEEIIEGGRYLGRDDFAVQNVRLDKMRGLWNTTVELPSGSTICFDRWRSAEACLVTVQIEAVCYLPLRACYRAGVELRN